MPIINSSKNLAKGASFPVVSGAESELVLLVEILPAAANSNYQNVGARLKINGTIIPILSYDESVSSSGAGVSVSVALARVEDKNLLTPDALFLIETFEANGDEAQVWDVILSGRINSKTLTTANENGKPSDTVTFTTDSTDKLQTSPENNLVIYDSSRADIDASEFETVYDTYGRAYSIDVVPFSGGLTLHTLFDVIFVQRCGFDEVITNLPNFPVRRADFSIFETYYDGIKPLIGIFDALIAQIDGKLFITDATLALPSGFPAPRTLEAAKIQTISEDSRSERVKGFELQFSQSETGEFFTARSQTFETQVTTRFGSYVSKTIRKVKYRQYRSNYARNIVLREVIESDTTEIYGADQVFPAQISTETFEFDYLGRQKRSVKTVQKRVPDLTGSVSLRDISTDELNHKYAVFPFAPRRSFLRRTEFSSEGLIAIDAETKYFGGDFPQGYADAHRSGNLKSGMSEVSGTLKSIAEDFTPAPDGTVNVITTTIDHTPEAVGRDAIVTVAHGEPRAGDVSVSGAGRAGRIRILPKNAAVRADEKLETLSVGELPLYIAIPLADRRLKRKQNGAAKLNISLVGWNKSVAPGIAATAEGRAGESAALIVEGYRKFARIENGSLNWGMTIEGSQI